MRHNGRTPLALSGLPPSLVMLYRGSRLVLACPDCGTWRAPRRGMLPAHRAADEVTRCPGSGQRVIVDVSPGQWAACLHAGIRDAATRRSSRAHGGRRPLAPPALSRIATR